ncbi:DUF4760 domain-containing protein [Luteibacter aegosomatis]|uniref:DUF4760 domain-containing protein n=1 Tax=Luteibacter aegosomatis TaxID=2911537 RepID=UPI001FFA64DF|nr:DUF4760 domain-containing protein [Luteibacter aegosomatis]UPG83917.1 DUF4760 domain-containing protein [Luteibacter aegosomatis]
MTTFETYTIILQAFALIAGLVTLGFLFAQMRAMTKQITTAQEASRTQASLSLVDFLQSRDVREARECVRSVLSKKTHDQWNDTERRHASLVCSNYDVLACLIRSNLSHMELFTVNWGSSILHCHKVLSPYMDEIRRQAEGDPSYWSNFDWLKERVVSRAARS